ncbi:helix-turn-helix domain-containing protein [Alcanivoracaceae bacterium MT1]
MDEFGDRADSRSASVISARALKRKNDDIKKMKIDLVIENNFSVRRLSLDFISQRSGVKRAEVERLLHRHGGIKRYIRQYRLQQAYIELVLNQKWTISRVAEKYGFVNLTTFSSVFEREYGRYPWDFKENVGAETDEAGE